jgi:hypothetical protein
MSELINKANNRTSMRWKLLTGASALVLTAYTSSIESVYAETADHPTVWIELGGALSRLQDGHETFSPPMMAGRPSIFEPSQHFEHPPKSSFDAEGSIFINPSHSDWTFGVSVQYGRAKSYKHEQQQTSPVPTSKYFFPDHRGYKNVVQPVAHRFAETSAGNSENHVILDFQVGKDVGLGLFGSAASTVSAGVRFAQFRSESNIALRSDPDWQFQHKYFDIPPYYYDLHVVNQPFHTVFASMTAKRSFTGAGPSLSWKSSLPLAGNTQDGGIEFDWGANFGVLFGRQKSQSHHQSTARYALKSIQRQTAVPHTTARGPATPDHSRSRSIAVPNIGGFAGLSFEYPNAKISVGYRADFFFGAMDGGIDTRKTYDRGFYGPFATISIGLGG